MLFHISNVLWDPKKVDCTGFLFEYTLKIARLGPAASYRFAHVLSKEHISQKGTTEVSVKLTNHASKAGVGIQAC